MDGKVLLLAFAGLFGGVLLLGQQNLSLGGDDAPVAGRAAMAGQVVNTRHAEIRRQLVQEGYDLNDPASFVRERDGLEVVGGPVAATEHLKPVFIHQIMPAYARPVASEVPEAPEALAPVAGCALAPVAAGARVANVFANRTEERVSLFALSDAELEAEAHGRIVRGAGGASPGHSGPDGVKMVHLADVDLPDRAEAPPLWSRAQYSVIEVVVTETDHPVHLVLQTGAGRVLWNLHRGDGVRLAGVTVLGGAGAAVANLPRDVPVEIMPSSKLAECGIVRERRPRASDPVFAAIDQRVVDEDRARAALAGRVARAEAWNLWFEAQFGLRSDESRIGYDTAAIMALVGPVPEAQARVPYHGLAGARVVMAAAPHVLTQKPAQAQDAIEKLVTKRIAHLVGERAEVN